MTPTNDWITDRRPTEADGDRDGEVLLRRFADYRRDSTTGSRDALVDWRHIGEGVPWKRTGTWESPATPESAKPALAVGQRWRRRDGEVVTVDKIDRNHPWGSTHPFWAGRQSYTPEGANHADGVSSNSCDLIELISKPELSTPTPRKFASISRTITGFGHIIDAIDEDGVAWWMGTSSDADSAHEWQQLTPLPGREVVG